MLQSRVIVMCRIMGTSSRYLALAVCFSIGSHSFSTMTQIFLTSWCERRRTYRKKETETYTEKTKFAYIYL
jgi:hypothetical protein